MARAMWKGAIQFGLVTIPVKLYLATDSKGISFNMLHAKDLSRIQMKIYCPADDEVISRGDTVRGYEWSPGEYVVVTDEDLEAVPLKTVRSIEIEQFVARDGASEEGPVRFAKQAYYIEPEKIGQKAFYLLKAVLEEKRLTAICKVVIKDREALASLDPFANTMLLTTLHWPDEIRAVSELDLPDEEKLDFKPAERAMAAQLIEAMTGDFEPEQFRDEYRGALQRVIEAKVEGKEVVKTEAEPESNLVDLMAALQASVSAAREARTAGSEKPTSVREAKAAREKAAREPERRAARAAKPAGEGGRGEAEAGAPEKRAARRADESEDTEEVRPGRRRKTA